MDILTADFAELGRYIAGITGDPEAAKIALSTSPQLRYDGYVVNLLKDPQRRDLFARDELALFLRRVDDQARRLAGWRIWGYTYGTPPAVEDLAEWDDDGGYLAVDDCWVEPDGYCVHGAPSWALVLGLI